MPHTNPYNSSLYNRFRSLDSGSCVLLYRYIRFERNPRPRPVPEALCAPNPVNLQPYKPLVTKHPKVPPKTQARTPKPLTQQPKPFYPFISVYGWLSRFWSSSRYPFYFGSSGGHHTNLPDIPFIGHQDTKPLNS